MGEEAYDSPSVDQRVAGDLEVRAWLNGPRATRDIGLPRIGVPDSPELVALACGQVDPLPYWEHLDVGAYQARVAEMATSIEEDSATERRARGIALLGVKAIQRQNAKRRPNRIKRSPVPAFHAASKRARLALVAAYRWFVAAYRDASERLRNGDRDAPFPEGCFPPSLPWFGSFSCSYPRPCQ